MKRRLQLGVFLPIANNGFLISKAAPQYVPTFALNRDIAQLAESIGLDYVFSMSKWRGFGGDTRFWDASLESVTLMTGLAVATHRIKLIATVNPLLYHPVLTAKIGATLDDISGGRIGFNIITGDKQEYGPMGLFSDNFAARRFQYAGEWVVVLKRPSGGVFPD